MSDTPLDLEHLDRERVAVLGTTRQDGTVHLVPVVFAVSGEKVVTAVDWKAKSGRKLARLANVETNPTVSLLAHHYSEDWDTLWWVRVDGRAELHRSGPVWEDAISALVAKYDQYRTKPPAGAVIVISPEGIRSWAAVR